MAEIIPDVIRTRLTSPLEVLRQRNFRLLWSGEFCSLLGDQFYWIALPWLVLEITGDPLVMGSLIAVQMIPRSLFMLIGGALTDRFSPRSVMLVSVVLRMLLVGTLSFLVLTGWIQIWSLYLLALLFGLVDGFFFPAQNSIVPSLLDVRILPAGNALIQGTAQLSMFIGPVIAGALIAWAGSPGNAISGGQAVNDMRGIGLAFGVDMVGYLMASIMLWRLNSQMGETPIKEAAEKENVLESIRTGLAYAWKNSDLRIFFFIVAVMALIVNGTITIGVPVLAKTRFREGAAAYGVIMSSFGAGSLFGILLASVLPAPSPRRTGRILLIVVSGLGFGLIVLAFVSSTLVAATIALMTGIGGGYILIMVITWLQKRTPTNMLGRTMSLLTFATLGLNPFAMALAGALSKLSVTSLLLGSGGLLSLIALGAAFGPAGRMMEG